MSRIRQKVVFILVILTLSVVKSVAAQQETIYFGTLGSDLQWEVSDLTWELKIKVNKGMPTGPGQMPDYVASTQPWKPYCSSIKTVVIENGVTSIGYSAFGGCPELTSITIPASVTSIGDYFVIGSNKLTSINVASGNTVYSSENGILFNKTKTELLTYPAGKSGSYTIPNGVTRIASKAFHDCAGLTSLTLSASVTSHGTQPFYGCSRLTSIDVASGNTAYSSETGVLFNKTQTELLAYPGGKSGSYTIPSSVKNIENSAFHLCTELTSITIPASVTSIKDAALGWCTGLTSLTIPNSVTSIESHAFYNCTGLTSVTVNWATPLKIDSDVFTQISSLSDIRLIVPFGTKALYQAAPVWKEFRIEESGTGIDDIQTATLVRLEQSGDELYISHPSATIDAVEIFDMNGRPVYRTTGSASPSISTSSWTRGMYLVVVRMGNSKTTHKLIKN